MTFTGSLKRGLVAGVCAGILAAVFAFVFAEPTLDRAIALEDQRAAAGQTTADHTHQAGTPAHDDAEPVSRDLQRRAGAPVGFIAVGAGLGVLFGLIYAALRRFAVARPPAQIDHWQRSLALGAAGLTPLLVVFLRYPPNPPGVGDPGAVDERTRYYFAALLLGLAVALGAWRLLGYLRSRGWAQSHRQSVTAMSAVLIIGLGYFVLPTPADKVSIPAKLLWDFRIQSLATQLLLWGGLSVGFGLLTERAARTSR